MAFKFYWSLVLTFITFSWLGNIQAQPNLDWNYINLNGIWDHTFDENGNMYVCGSYYNSQLDILVGPGTYNLDSIPNGQAYVAKYSGDGQSVLWARTFQTTGYSEMRKIKVCGNQVLVSGNVDGSYIDLDPGLDTVGYVAEGGVDIFYVKLDTSGQFISGLGLGCNFSDGSGEMVADSEGNMYIIAFLATGDTVDMDPGPGFQPVYWSSGINGSALAKYDSLGNYQWHFYHRGVARDLEMDDDNNVYYSATLESFVDVAPGPAVLTIGPSTFGGSSQAPIIVKIGENDTVVCVHGANGGNMAGTELDENNHLYYSIYNANGASFIIKNIYDTATYALSWDPHGIYGKITPDNEYKYVRGINMDYWIPKEMTVLPINDHLFISGWYMNTVDFNAGPGVNNLTSNGLQEIFLLEVDTLGNYVFAGSIGLSASDFAWEISSFHDQLYLLYDYGGSFSGTADVDFGPGVTTISGNPENFLAKYAIPQINVTSVNASNFCFSDSIILHFTSDQVFNPGNIFTAQLLDLSNNFLYTLGSSATSPITAPFPLALSGTSTSFKVRVNSSDPVYLGNFKNQVFNVTPIVNPVINFPLSACHTYSSFTFNVNPPGGTLTLNDSIVPLTINPSTMNPGTYVAAYYLNGCSDTILANFYITDCLGMEDHGDNGVSIYPNPSEGTSIIQFKELGEYSQGYLLDGVGKVVMQISIPSNSNFINFHGGHLSPGMYTMVLTYSEEKKVALKWIRQ